MFIEFSLASRQADTIGEINTYEDAIRGTQFCRSECVTCFGKLLFNNF